MKPLSWGARRPVYRSIVCTSLSNYTATHPGFIFKFSAHRQTNRQTYRPKYVPTEKLLDIITSIVRRIKDTDRSHNLSIIENEKDCMPAIITAREFRAFVYLLAEYEFGFERFFVELVDHVN